MTLLCCTSARNKVKCEHQPTELMGAANVGGMETSSAANGFVSRQPASFVSGSGWVDDLDSVTDII